MRELPLSHIEYSGPLVRLDRNALPDLDTLLLDIYADPALSHETRADMEEDWPTRLPGGAEGRVGVYRKNPCACGGGHGFELGEVDMDDDGIPVGRAARGAFLGIWFA